MIEILYGAKTGKVAQYCQAQGLNWDMPLLGYADQEGEVLGVAGLHFAPQTVRICGIHAAKREIRDLLLRSILFTAREKGYRFASIEGVEESLLQGLGIGKSVQLDTINFMCRGTEEHEK